MAPSSLNAFLEIESSPQLTSPRPALRKDKHGAAQAPSDYELDDIQQAKDSTRVTSKSVAPPTTCPPSPSPSELEQRLSMPQATHETPTWAVDRTVTSWKTKWRMSSVCLMSLGSGMNDSAPGALIPYIEKHYNIGYAIVSLIFVTNALGFILAAPLTHSIERKLGRARSYALALSVQAIGYVVIICQPPFPAVVASFFLLGFGMALALALSNVYCANLANYTTALGCSHGFYGIGGIIAPLFATAMVSDGIRWSFFYIITLAVAIFNLGYVSWAFHRFENDSPNEPPLAARSTTSHVNDGEPPSRTQVLKKTIRNRTTLLGALFIFAYQGAEVSISGWVVSFLISYRHGDPSQVGYVSAGFWTGITVGRFLLTHPASSIGEKIAVAGMIAGAVAFQLLTWLVPNVIGDGVAVSILGLLLGAVYPCATSVFTRLIPHSMQISSLSFISALGSSGGAVSPFFTGILAQKVGTIVLHPICIGLYGVMAISWLLLPKVVKRTE